MGRRNEPSILSLLSAYSRVLLLSLQLVPTNPVSEEVSRGKSRKRLNPVIHTEAPEPDPIREAYLYCNFPNQTEHTWEGHSLADYKLLSVQVMIRHGDRYPLYSIPQTKRPAIDCTLSPNRVPSHPLLASFISHMALGAQGHWDTSLASLPRIPNNRVCEMGELTQTGNVTGNNGTCKIDSNCQSLTCQL
uniref:2-phosphoxylose phosphatase 1 n=1 Tax=Electrophorus electricus TaxID=8005 RepID=A0A4W4GGG0_ELEEL